MELKNKRIGYCFTGSFCTFEASIKQMEKLVKEEKATIFPIMSYNSYNLDTKFGSSEYFRDKIERITGNPIIHTIQDSEPIGPKDMLDILIIAPCSGNTLSKIANDINDTSITMAVKSILRREKPVVIAVSTNNALSRKC